jgi:hypothetical protein
MSLLPLGTLHRSSDFTATSRSTKELIGHVKDRLTKPDPRPKLHSQHHHCQTVHSIPGQQPRPQALLHRPPSKVDSETMSIKRRKIQTSTSIARSRGSEVSLRSRNRGRSTHILLDHASNKVMTPTYVTIAGSNRERTRISSGAVNQNLSNRPTLASATRTTSHAKQRCCSPANRPHRSEDAQRHCPCNKRSRRPPLGLESPLQHTGATTAEGR